MFKALLSRLHVQLIQLAYFEVFYLGSVGIMRQMAVQLPGKFTRRDKDRLFQFLLLANFLEYLEAGAVPALLLQLSTSFHMSPGQQGLLGGVVYLSLSIGGPFAGE